MSHTAKKLCVLGFCTFGFLFSVNGQEAKPRFPMPKAKYKVRIEKSVMIPMRDGVKLSTDLYFPEGAGEKLPVIMVRTPYNKNAPPGSDGDTPFDLVGQDYVIAVQDVRGKFESEGDYIVSAADTNDGYDTVEWLASQSWSTGKIGTTGCSYPGENQVEMAV
jgi:putative CocE/NonD family hydrolase